MVDLDCLMVFIVCGTCVEHALIAGGLVWALTLCSVIVDLTIGVWCLRYVFRFTCSFTCRAACLCY